MAELAGKKIVIAGGSGFLGISMAQHFADAGASVSILSRSVPKVSGDWTRHAWDARTLSDWTDAINGSDAVVNLVGRTVNCIKTPDHQDEILRSRVESTNVLGQAMRTVASPPPVLSFDTPNWSKLYAISIVNVVARVNKVTTGILNALAI